MQYLNFIIECFKLNDYYFFFSFFCNYKTAMNYFKNNN